MLLVTGAAGYIGSMLIHELYPGVSDIRAIDDFSEGLVEQIKDIRVEKMDITDLGDVERMMEGVDTVVHLAAITGIQICEREPSRAADVNLAGVKHIIDVGARKSLRRIIFPSSFAVYGNPPEFINEQTPTAPINFYGIMKRATEDIVRSAKHSYGIEGLVFRQSNLFGKGLCRKRSLINAMTARALSGEPLTVIGTGEQVRDFVHVRDVVWAYRRALETGLTGLHHLGAGVSTSVNEVVRTIAAVAREVRGIDVQIVRQEKRVQGKQEVDAAFHFDISSLRERFGYEPNLTVEDAVRELMADPDCALKGW